MAIVAKRTIMSLYSEYDDIFSQQVRIVLAEKCVSYEFQPLDQKDIRDDLKLINPYPEITPTLVDKDLILYKANIIMDYLEDRFPHPPLLPVYPVARAQARKMMFRIKKDWYKLFDDIKNGINVAESKEKLLESLISLEPIFADKPYFLSEEFSLLDCVLAPLLWRFPPFDLIIDEQKAPALTRYMNLIFSRPSFQASLTEVEKKLRAA